MAMFLLVGHMVFHLFHLTSVLALWTWVTTYSLNGEPWTVLM